MLSSLCGVVVEAPFALSPRTAQQGGGGAVGRGAGIRQHHRDGRHAVAPLSAVGPVPVGIICVPLLDRAADTIESRRLRGSEAVSALMARPRVATLVEGEFSAAVFRLCSAIAGQLPVWEVRGPWGSVEPDLGRRLRVALTPLMGDEGHNAA